MQIGCTKKLLDTRAVNVADHSEENELFCWSANLLTIKRKKAVVVVNDSNRFGFVLYGLKAKDFGQLKTWIEKGIRRCLVNENIKEEIIQAYFAQAGETVFTKTRGRVAVARLNKACGVAEFFADRLDATELYQTEVSRAINSDLFKPSPTTDYRHPYELLAEEFKQAFGENIIAMEGVDLLIKLDLGAVYATRRLVIPMGITFKELHKIIQIAFDWRNSHLYDFNLFDESGHCVLNIISEHEEVFEPRQDCPMVWDKDIWIDEYVKAQMKILYTYDYGDDWRHEITVLGIVPDYDKNYPTCILAEGNRPPEDVGGISGFERYQEIMNDPDHPEHEETKHWTAGQWYRDFEMDLTNQRLRHVLMR